MSDEDEIYRLLKTIEGDSNKDDNIIRKVNEILNHEQVLMIGPIETFNDDKKSYSYSAAAAASMATNASAAEDNSGTKRADKRKVVDSYTLNGVLRLSDWERKRFSSLVMKRLKAHMMISSSSIEEGEDGNNDEEFVDICSSLISHIGGEQSRSSLVLTVNYASRVELRISLSSFALGDVGARIWGGARILGNWIINNQQMFQGKRVLEIGSGCGFCGVIASFGSSIKGDKEILPPKEVILSDFNQACLKSCDETIKLNEHLIKASVRAMYFDWKLADDFFEGECMVPDIILGAAVIYEPIHVDLVSHLLDIYFKRNPAGLAVITAHEGHYGVKEFRLHLTASKEKLSFKEISCDIIDSIEDDRHQSPVVIMLIGSKE